MDNNMTEMTKKYRSHWIGGSDLAAIIGECKWRTPMDVFMEKVYPDDAIEQENEQIEWGKILEPVVVAKYENKTGLKTVSVPTQYHPKYEWAAANVDRMVLDGDKWDRVLEVKTTRTYWSDGIPKPYLFQVQWYLEISGMEQADLAVLRLGSQFEILQIKKDQGMIDYLLEKAEEFWTNHVLTKEPPPPRAVKDVLKLYPDHKDGKVKQVDESVADDITRLLEIRGATDELEQERTKILDRVTSCFGDAEKIQLGDIILATYKKQTSKRLNIAAIKRDYPDIAKEKEIETSTRIFRIKI